MSSTRKFNWKGISENYDGSFNVEDKRARRRLLKELHGQGFKVRSKKIEGDGYQLSPIGQGSFKASKASAPIRSAARPRMAYSSYRRLPHRTGRMQPRLVPYPNRPRSFSRPYYGAPPRVSGVAGPGILNKTGEWMKRRRQQRIAKLEQEQKEKIEFKKNEHEINEKMKKERIEQERAETARKAEKDQFAHEAYRQKRREEAERVKSRAGIKSEWHGGAATTTEPTKHKEPKPDNSKLAEARQEYITGA